MGRNKKVVILGAGFAGLWLARRLLAEGFDVEILERNPAPGGLMETIALDGFLFDLGPHILLAPHLDHYRKVLGEDLLRIDGFYGFGYRGRQIPSPLSPGNLIRSLGPASAVPFAASMLWQRIPFVGARPPWDNVDEILTRRFGRRVNEAFFRHYIPKVTGLPSTEVSPDWFLERYRFYREHSLWRKLLQRAVVAVGRLLPGQAPTGASGLELYYPRGGARMLTEALAREIADLGGLLRLGATVKRVEVRKGRVDAVIHSSADGADGRAQGDFFVSTLPVNRLPRMFGGVLGEPAARAADQLAWRHLRLFFLGVKRDRVSDKIQIYFTEGKYPFKRIYEPKNLIPDMGRPGRTGLCVEVCYSDVDEIDRADEGILGSRIVDSVCDFFGLSTGEVELLASRRAPHAYAVYRTGYRQQLGEIASALFSVGNFVSYGRQGSFRYNHLVDRIIDASDAVVGYLRDGREDKGKFLGTPDPKSDFF